MQRETMKLLFFLSLVFVFSSHHAIAAEQADYIDEPLDNSLVREKAYSSLRESHVKYFSYIPKFEMVRDQHINAMVIYEFGMDNLYIQYEDGQKELVDSGESVSHGFISAQWLILPEQSPVLITEWNNGVHGQGLRIFAPSPDNTTELAYSQTGVYFVSYEVADGNVIISYDGYGDNDEMQTKIDVWPHDENEALFQEMSRLKVINQDSLEDTFKLFVKVASALELRLDERLIKELGRLTSIIQNNLGVNHYMIIFDSVIDSNEQAFLAEMEKVLNKDDYSVFLEDVRSRQREIKEGNG